jgi:hypothetical protein
MMLFCAACMALPGTAGGLLLLRMCTDNVHQLHPAVRPVAGRAARGLTCVFREPPSSFSLSVAVCVGKATPVQLLLVFVL